MQRDQVLRQLAEQGETLRQRGVRKLAVFGSVANGTASTGSDVDLLVEVDSSVGLFDFIRLKTFLEDVLGTTVDLVTPDALTSPIRDRILREAVHASI